MMNWNEKSRKEKTGILLSLLGVLALLGVVIYSVVTPDFFWIMKEDGLQFYKKRILLMAAVTLLGVYVCFGKFDGDEEKEKKKSILIFLLTPIYVFLFMEFANPAGPSLIWNKIYLVSVVRSLVTILILFLVMAVFFAVTNSMRFSGGFLCAFAAVFCVGNYFVNKFRGIPLLASDLTTVGTAMNVAGDYKYILDFCQLLHLDAMIVWCVLLFRIQKVKLPKGKTHAKYALASLAVFAASAYIMIYTPMLRQGMHITINTFRPIKSYKKNGGILTFLRSIQLMIVEKPDGYTIQTVEDIADPYQEEAAQADEAMTPNVIVIMDEAFADLQAVGDFETSEEVMPYYKSLTENTVKGFVYVSVFGGQTANTEFEFLTGLSKAFIPESSTPYQLYIKDRLPGLTTNMENQDYQGMIAFHPYNASGYNRHNVYPNLGFADFISKEDLTIQESDLLRNHISDARDFEIVIEEYEKAKAESDAPFYLFNVTMQNHSAYDRDFDNFEQTIEIEEAYDDPDAKRYLNLVHYSDAALQTLIEYFEDVEEPTVIVFFGDHEPGLSDEFYSKLFGKSVEELTAQENLEMYKTPFLIWANYDIEEKTGVTTSMNYLSTLMLESAGMKLTPFNYFLSDMSEEVPVLTSHGYYGSDGNFYELSDTESPYYETLQTYNMLQYNNLFDQKKRISGFFE